jgi:hypothetical protein
VNTPSEPDRPNSCASSWVNAAISSQVPPPMFSMTCSDPDGAKNICPSRMVNRWCWFSVPNTVTRASPTRQ